MNLTKKVDTERNRKLIVTNRAVDRLTLGLLACLGVAAYKPELGLMLAGLLVPWAASIVAGAKLFFDAHVAVHQASGGEAPPAPAPAPPPAALPAVDQGSDAAADPGLPLAEGWHRRGVLQVFVRSYQDSDGDGIEPPQVLRRLG